MSGRGLLVLVVLALGAAGCSAIGNLFSTSPSGSTTDDFAGSVAVGGNSFFTFTVTQGGSVSVTLTTLGGSTPIGLGVGTPIGTTGCQLTNTSQSTLAGSAPQLTVTEAAGNYCVEVFDPGTLTAPASFAVTVAHS